MWLPIAHPDSRAYEDYLTEVVHITGTVVEWSELDYLVRYEEPGYRLRIDTDGGGEVIAYHYGERLVEGDRVQVIGAVLPLVTYTTVLGAERTLPALAVVRLVRES